MIQPQPPLEEVLPNLYRYRDTCNVYLIRDGDHGLLVDFGSGQILDELETVGVRTVDWVLHTHHHRDQCQGDGLLNARGIPIAVPQREAGLFEDVDAFWRQRRIYDNYDVSSTSFALQRPVQISHRLLDYEAFVWRGHTIGVLPTPGHTKGSISLIVTVSGRRVAFVGDLIAGSGHLHTIHDLQWQYGAPDGVGAALHSVELLAAQGTSRLLPSHGSPMADPVTALTTLARNLDRLYRLQAEISLDHAWRMWPHVLDQGKVRVSDHIWSNPHSVANTYAVVADSGRGMLLDYGYPSWDHFYADQRFVEHSIDDFAAVSGMRSVDVVIPSHYHDDHLAGVPWLQQAKGTEAWIFEQFSDIVREPARYNIPCLLGTPIRVDRELADGERFAWEGFEFESFHMPGHTWWAGALFGEVDGLRVAFTGDNMFAGAVGPLRAGGPIYRNRMLAGSFARGVSRLLEFKPEILLTGHTGAIEVSSAVLEGFHTWARQLDDALVRLVAVPSEIDFALDPNFVVLDPYHTTAIPGSTVQLEVRVTNHGPAEVPAIVQPSPPDGWSMVPAETSGVGPRVLIPGRGVAGVRFQLSVPEEARGRHVVCVDLTLGGRRWGLIAEAIVDVQPAA